jgi:hypothetical protein
MTFCPGVTFPCSGSERPLNVSLVMENSDLWRIARSKGSKKLGASCLKTEAGPASKTSCLL